MQTTHFKFTSRSLAVTAINYSVATIVESNSFQYSERDSGDKVFGQVADAFHNSVKPDNMTLSIRIH